MELFGELSKHFLARGDHRKHLAFKAHKVECEAMLFKESRKFDLYVQKLREAEDIWRSLGDEKNATWCRANIDVELGTKCFLAKRYEEAIQYYDNARKAFIGIDLKKPAKFSEAYLKWSEANLLKDADPRKASELLNSASRLFQEVGLQKHAKICEAEATYCEGIAKFKEGDFQGAKELFLRVASISESLGSKKFSNFYKARAHECDYRIAKLSGNIKAATVALQAAASLFHEAGAEEAYYVCMGDFHKLNGLYAKSQGGLREAIREFHEAKEYYSEASKVSRQHKLKHEKSAEYMEALIASTEADCALCLEYDLERAADLYLETASKFRKLGDESAASFNNNIGLFLKAVVSEDLRRATEIAEALYQYYKLKGPSELPSVIHNVIRLSSMLTTLLKRHLDEQMLELREEDAGFSFEARVRELIRKFDGRTVAGSLLGSGEDRVVLHRYEEVREASFEPEDDEVGIVFDDKSVIEIDALAVRRERGRRFMLVCECKYRSRKLVSVSDLELLERKAKFLEVRYGKIARLEGELRPIVEEKWFVTTSGFEDSCADYARHHGIRLIDLKRLNKLMHEFGLRRILEPRSRALTP